MTESSDDLGLVEVASHGLHPAHDLHVAVVLNALFAGQGDRRLRAHLELEQLVRL